MTASILLGAAVVLTLSLALQGCGDSGGGGSYTFKLAPLVVKGQNFYDSVSGAQFHPKGIGFPNVGKDVNVTEWIAVLQRIKGISSEINMIRLYEPPTCALKTGDSCFEAFMQEADKLGIYVLAPGSGTDWGYFPGLPSACGPTFSMQGCYTTGGVLGFGRTVVENFNFPNTMAIILANEMEQNMEALPVLKAYARDLKLYMSMCNSNGESPSSGNMRQIPLMYAATDSAADTWPEADYLFCGSQDVSIDVFGLNCERWVSDAGGRGQYDQINKIVAARKWPGAYMHSEEGGPYGGSYPAVPTWNQIPGYFTNWPAINGFSAYVYYGHPQYNMFDGPSASANELPDGKAFFSELDQGGTMPPDVAAGSSITPECKTTITRGPKSYPLADYNAIKIYDTGANGWAKNCPKPALLEAQVSVESITV